jgi:hypothetical protein
LGDVHLRFGGNIGSTFKDQAVREECLPLENEMDGLVENVRNEAATYAT